MNLVGHRIQIKEAYPSVGGCKGLVQNYKREGGECHFIVLDSGLGLWFLRTEFNIIEQED